MTTTARLDPAAARAAAQQLYDERMTAVDTLVAATNAARELADQLTTAERAVARAYADAQRAGWTDEDLKRIGLEVPTRRAPGRPVGTRNTTIKQPPNQSSANKAESLAVTDRSQNAGTDTDV